MVMTLEPDLKLDEVAKALRVNPETVRVWLRSGRLKGYRLGGKRAGWRIPAAELERFRRDAMADGTDGE
jgi:excisionase family DNA binding protein